MKRNLILLVSAAAILGSLAALMGKPLCDFSQWQKGEAIQLKGELTMIARPATFVTNGKTYKLHIGPNWYWNEQKLELKTGTLEVTGKMLEIDGAMNIFPASITQNGTKIVLTDDEGLPKWSAQCKSKCKGQGQGKCQGKCKKHRNCQKSN